MSDIQTKSIARRFIQEIFNEGKIEDAKKFVTSDIIYHGVFDEVKGLENFKKWIAEDRDVFPDMKVTIIDDFGEQNKVAIRYGRMQVERNIQGLRRFQNGIKPRII